MKFNKFNLLIVTLAAMALAGCKDEDVSGQHYDNKLFISASGFSDLLLFEEEVTDLSRQLVAKIAKQEPRDITLTYAADPGLLERYRKIYNDPDVTALPEECYRIGQPQATIPAGRATSTSVTVEFPNLNRLDGELRYVLPVTIASATGIDILPSARTMYYVFRKAALVNVVADLNENCAWPEWANAAPVTDMSAFTLEALIYGNGFDREISTVMGIEDIFLIRIGDTGIPSNQLQVAMGDRSTLTSDGLLLKPRQWYHVAVTFDAGKVTIYLDGVEKASGTAPAASVNFGVAHSDETEGKPRCFWVGYSYDANRYLNGRVSEARIWNKALTAEQINARNHFYKVAPDSEGLVAYWKFDTGAGKTVKDHTVWGNDLTAEKDIKWIQVELPEK